jgi:hypothetical protein
MFLWSLDRPPLIPLVVFEKVFVGQRVLFGIACQSSFGPVPSVLFSVVQLLSWLFHCVPDYFSVAIV